MVAFRTQECQTFTIVEFQIDVIAPDDLVHLDPPVVNATKGVILTGRGPIWLYGALVHHYHPTRWVATHDPRLGGAVVVASHGGPPVGSVVPTAC
jgi:CRISPR-associated protein Csx3